uniref:Uncharacterized protein n=1 Tax=Panagrolaimus superbus TaxID=310955 RepID=A0A914ZFB6_9BILA
MTAVQLCCCNLHILKCANFIAFIGIGIFSWIFVCLWIPSPTLLTWIYAPLCAAFILAFIFIFVGVKKMNSGWLAAAQFILGINIGVSLLLAILSIFIAIYTPYSTVNDHIDKQDHDIKKAEKKVQFQYFVMAFFITIFLVWAIFVLIVIKKSREYLKQNSQRICSLSEYPFVVNFNTVSPPSYSKDSEKNASKKQINAPIYDVRFCRFL